MADKDNTAHSDHQALKIVLRLKVPIRKPKPKKRINWDRLMDAGVQGDLNSNCVDVRYEESEEHVKDDAKEVALEDANNVKGLFEHSKGVLEPIIKQGNDVLYEAKTNGGNDEFMKQQCRYARSDVKNAVEVAKGRWMEHLVNDVKNINLNPRRAWDKIKLLSDGHKGHHAKTNSMKFRDDDGNVAVSDKDNANVALEIFNKVLNRDVNVVWNYVRSRRNKSRVDKLAEPLSWKEFNCAIDKLTWHKEPELNGTSPNLIKALNNHNRSLLFRFMCDLTEDETIVHEEWMKLRLVPLPKKSDLHDLNNWKCTNLLGVVPKVMTMMLNTRAQKLL